MPGHNEQRATNDELIAVHGVDKSFAGVRVLKNVSFTLSAGRTLGLVGENGAGKSTLMNILGGNHQPDAGQMKLDGVPFAPRNPTEAARRGLAFIHQELNLFPNLSIAENVFLTNFPRTAGLPWIHRGRLRARTAELLAQVGLNLPPETLVERLPAGERQLVEIAKALSIDARFIILDEPTTSLSARETENLFALLRRLRERGLSLIYISHILGDVLQLCDDIVVLRDGEVVGSGPAIEFTAARMITLMVGRSLRQLYPTRRAGLKAGPASSLPCERVSAGTVAAAPPRAGKMSALLWPGAESQPVLEVKRLSQPHIVHNIDFTLHRGEVLGIFGLMGAGRSELARILFGLDPQASGEIRLDGKPLGRARPLERIHQGLAFLTEDRRAEGLCLEASIADNIALVSLRQHARTPMRLLDASRWRDSIRAMREAVRLTARANDAQPVKTLSGGNQQKVVLAKWLLAKPCVLILDEPTRGIDVGAKFEVYQLIHELADQGAGVLIISSEIEELIGIGDRILVMRRGEITSEFRREEFDREKILAAALHTSTS
jgi:ribose transport system ATP-binding protein